jgi:hypothetical protein
MTRLCALLQFLLYEFHKKKRAPKCLLVTCSVQALMQHAAVTVARRLATKSPLACKELVGGLYYTVAIASAARALCSDISGTWRPGRHMQVVA